MNEFANSSTCKRCGTCCEKGGPAFHTEDRAIIEKGLIHSRHLYTIRKGELARDNITKKLISVNSDIIKLKGQASTWTCCFYNKQEKTCTIYEHRPIECRVLACWDTEAIEKIYSRNYLTREMLLAETGELWAVIKDHQQKCDYEKVIQFNKLPENDKKTQTLKEIVDMMQYDMSIRDVLVEKGQLDNKMLDFFLGRPLVDSIKNYGFILRKNEKNKIILTPSK